MVFSSGRGIPPSLAKALPAFGFLPQTLAPDGDPIDVLLLMDEPFGALDPLTRMEMQEMLSSLLVRLRKTVVLVTHDVDEALALAIGSCFLTKANW